MHLDVASTTTRVFEFDGSAYHGVAPRYSIEKNVASSCCLVTMRAK